MRHKGLWCLAISFYLVGDIATTLIGISMGATEGNPLQSNPDLWTMVFYKSLPLTVGVLGQVMAKKRHEWIFPATVFVIGLLIVVWNLGVIGLLI